MTKDSTVVYTKWFETAKTCLNKKEYTNFLHCLAEYIMNGDVPETLKGTKGYKILYTQDIPKVISKNTEKWLRKKSKMNQKQSENDSETNEIETDSERNRNGFWGQSLDNEECESGVSVPVTDNVSVTVTEDSKESYNNNVYKDNSLIPPTREKKSLAFKNENEFQDYCREYIKGWYDEGLSKNEMNERFNYEVKNGDFIRQFFPNDGRFERHLHMFCNVWDTYNASRE